MTDEKTNVSTIKTVAESAEKTRQRDIEVEESNIVELSNGITFRVSPVPQTAFVDLRNSFPEPAPPIFHNPDTGRDEPNMNDPRYLAKHADWEVALSVGMIDIQLIFGAEVEHVPDGMIKYDNKKFNDKLRVILGAMGWSREDIKDLGDTEKYLLWIKYYAAKGGLKKVQEGDYEGDLGKLMLAIGRQSGVPEADVKLAVDNFQDQNT